VSENQIHGSPLSLALEHFQAGLLVFFASGVGFAIIATHSFFSLFNGSLIHLLTLQDYVSFSIWLLAPVFFILAVIALVLLVVRFLQVLSENISGEVLNQFERLRDNLKRRRRGNSETLTRFAAQNPAAPPVNLVIRPTFRISFNSGGALFMWLLWLIISLKVSVIELSPITLILSVFSFVCCYTALSMFFLYSATTTVKVNGVFVRNRKDIYELLKEDEQSTRIADYINDKITARERNSIALLTVIFSLSATFTFGMGYGRYEALAFFKPHVDQRAGAVEAVSACSERMHETPKEISLCGIDVIRIIDHGVLSLSRDKETVQFVNDYGFLRATFTSESSSIAKIEALENCLIAAFGWPVRDLRLKLGVKCETLKEWAQGLD
jgi:hypothetical protein